jgi:hypothetical protein
MEMFSDMPQWIQTSIPWVVVLTMFGVAGLTAWAVGTKIVKWLSSKRSALD